MATETKVFSDLPIPPGELLTETLEALNLSQAELARRMDRPVQAINEIARGTKEITPETAIQMERVLGVPAYIWLGLETEYQHTKARLDDRKRLEDEAALTRDFPCGALARFGWIPKTHDRLARAADLLSFFGVSSLRMVQEAEAAAYRISRARKAKPEALAAWLRKAELEAQRIVAGPFNESTLRTLLPELRRLTRETPAVFEPRVKQRLAQSGVVLVLLPHLPKTYAHGAARWVSPDKAIVQVSIRYRWADIFWFSLFHELAHVLLHNKRETFISWDEGDKDQQESEADKFASEHLLPEAAYRAFVQRTPRISASAVTTFARSQGIAAGIVVGRLQHDKVIARSDLNGLRVQFEWAA
jgi:HTH-type transcriptional regulator/antitoxin HigA